MYRKIMGFLKEWKESEHRKPLILQGARQVGKTYSILEFGRTDYENVAYFNFETNPKLGDTFEENISPDYLIPILSHIAGQTIVKEKTLIVFDEVQLCERALTSLKYFCEDAPDYHIIVAGSLLGVAVNRTKFSFPVGKVDMKTLYPMDMEEFMLALGEKDLTEQIKKQFKEQIDAGHKQNKELQEKLRVLTENQKKATEAQEIATKKHNEQVEAANKLNKELQDKLRVLTENQKQADEEQQIANKKHIEQIEAAQKQNQSLQEQLKTLNESQKKLQIIHQKQQEDLGKNLTKMQDANTLLQKSLEKATMQNAETLKELNHAKEQAKELEHSMSELKSKNGTNIWMWIAISAILILLCMLVL